MTENAFSDQTIQNCDDDQELPTAPAEGEEVFDYVTPNGHHISEKGLNQANALLRAAHEQWATSDDIQIGTATEASTRDRVPAIMVNPKLHESLVMGADASVCFGLKMELVDQRLKELAYEMYVMEQEIDLLSYFQCSEAKLAKSQKELRYLQMEREC